VCPGDQARDAVWDRDTAVGAPIPAIAVSMICSANARSSSR
jgi:hypothetical protein